MKSKPEPPIRKHADNTAKIATIFKKHKEIEKEFRNLIKDIEAHKIKSNKPFGNDLFQATQEREMIIDRALTFCSINIYVLNQLELEFSKIEGMMKNANPDRNTFFSNNSTIMGNLKFDVIETRNIISLFKESVQSNNTDLSRFFFSEYHKKFQEDYGISESLTSSSP